MNTTAMKAAPQEAAPTAKGAEPCAMVIFGATGDPTGRKLMPALYNLLTAKLLNEHFVVIGVGRRAYTDEAFRQEIAQALDSFATEKVETEHRDWILKRVFYVGGNFDAPETYKKLNAKLE